MEYIVKDEKGEFLGLASVDLVTAFEKENPVQASVVGCRSCKRSRITFVEVDGIDEPQPKVEWYLEDTSIYGPARKGDKFARSVQLEKR